MDKIQSLGVLKFSDKGVLFAGDNISGNIIAIDLSQESKSAEGFEINVYNIDAKIAAVLGTVKENILIHDLAVHPFSGEVYLSISRGEGRDAFPALLKVDATNQIQYVDLSLLEVTTQALHNLPDHNRRIALRGTGSAPTKKEIAKSKQSLRTLSIVSIEYHVIVI